MKQTNMADWTDLLHHAVTLGYGWNEAHDFLVADEVCPMYEARTRDIYPGVGDDYGWSDASCKIVESYLKKEGVTEVTLT